MRLIDADKAEKILSGFDWQETYLPVHFQENVLDICCTVVDFPCLVGDVVYADLRENKKKKLKGEDLAPCIVKEISIDKSYPEPLFTVIRYEFDVCHVGEKGYERYWSSDFGKEVFTSEEYFEKFI